MRTIHYYTSEGLLPSPAGSTRGASYTDAHLARLRMIAALRDEGLALGKIRERLAPLTDEQILHVAEALNAHIATGDGGPLTTLGLIDLEVTRQNLPLNLDEPFVADASNADPALYLRAPAPAPLPSQPGSSAKEYLDNLLRRNVDPVPQARRKQAPDANAIWRYNQPASEPPEVWYQFQIDDGIELRLRQDRYRQTKGRPGALIDAVRAHLRRHGLLLDPGIQEDDPPDH